jgi:hypothetical protein
MVWKVLCAWEGRGKKEEPGSEEEERGCHASGEIGMASQLLVVEERA